jgi:hypothetical protein
MCNSNPVLEALSSPCCAQNPHGKLVLVAPKRTRFDVTGKGKGVQMSTSSRSVQTFSFSGTACRAMAIYRTGQVKVTRFMDGAE